jgi:hypothetical protein
MYSEAPLSANSVIREKLAPFLGNALGFHFFKTPSNGRSLSLDLFTVPSHRRNFRVGEYIVGSPFLSVLAYVLSPGLSKSQLSFPR